MDIDEIAYLDQLYEKAQSEVDPALGAGTAKERFIRIVWELWPQISATFDEHKHSL